MLWSEVKGICYESMICKIGLYDFLTEEIEIDKLKKLPFPVAGECLNCRHGMTPMTEGKSCLY